MSKASHFMPFDTMRDHCIVGVDPGKLSGVALWVPAVLSTSIYASAELTQDEIIPWIKDQISDAQDVRQTTLRICTFAVEHFQQARGGRPLTSQPDAIRVTEMLRAFADELTCGFITFTPSVAKHLAHNQRMRKIEWYKSTKNGHETDARRQILCAIARHHPEELRYILEKENEEDAAR